MKSVLLSILVTFGFLSVNGQKYYLLVGTYDSPKSEGIYVYKFNSADGSATEISHVKTSNPSFLAISPDQKYVYAVNENADSTKYTVTGHVAAFSFNKKEGTLSFLNKQESGGKHPCYVYNHSGKWVFAGNYSSGNFSVLPVRKNGSLGSATTVIQHEGSGPDTVRQGSPHVHGIFFAKDNYHFYVTDLGTDKVMKYHFDSKNGKAFADKIPYVLPLPGGGPRHMAIHPNGKYLYLLEELTGTVVVFKDYGSSDIHEIQNHSSLPLYYKGPAGSADIHISADGKFLYCSNRGNSNTIGIFSIDATTGLISLVGHQPTLGEGPRNFNFDPTGKFLLVANQNSDEIVVFKRNQQTGLLTDSGKRIAVGKPVCIKWIPVK